VKTLGVLVSLILVVLVMPAAAQTLDVASYDIEVALDPKTHELTGTQSVRWRNTTGVATSEIWFHLYLNAFASSESTYSRELERDPMGSWGVKEGGWGWTRISRLSLADGADLLPSLSFERPDDGNQNDFTVARVELPREVLPGEAVEFELDFEARLPRVVARTGYEGEFHMVAQWFPKVGVFEGENGWNCHQFHAVSEFFADFGSYRVRMTIPRGWVVGATGEQISREPVGTDDVVEFVARDVHDFAWAAAPASLMTVIETDFEPGRDVPQLWLERAVESFEVGAGELELPPMNIRLLVPTTQRALAPRMIRAARLAVAWFGLHLGPYPYPQLTVVSPPAEASAADGMEYPTLFTTGASRLDAYPPWSWMYGIESVTVHEFGHQYFQGLLASNEFEGAWLDEGLTTWAHMRCLDDIIADKLVPEIRFPLTWEIGQIWLSFVEMPVRVDLPVWEQRLIVDAVMTSYGKTALSLRTLEGVLGESRLLRAMRAYVDEYSYQHPTGENLRSVLERETDEELGWFFDGVIRDGLTPDWAVLAVRHHWVRPVEGMVWRDGRWYEADDEDDPGLWRIEIELGRLTDLVGPVEVELRWETGRIERRTWDGRDSWVRWTEESPELVIQVVVDPDGAWALETRRANNYWRMEHWSRDPADSGPLWWFDGALRLLNLITVPGS